MEFVKNAELFAKKKHVGLTKKDGITLDSKHLEDVVNRLKSLGVIDQEILCAGWLHDTLERTNTSFDELFEKFGRRIAVLVSSLSKDMSLPRKKREQEYVKQLAKSSFDAKLVKLCDISANLSEMKNSDFSKSKRIRNISSIRQYLNVIKKDLIENTEYPKVFTLLDTIDQSLKSNKKLIKTK